MPTTAPCAGAHALSCRFVALSALFSRYSADFTADAPARVTPGRSRLTYPGPRRFHPLGFGDVAVLKGRVILVDVADASRTVMARRLSAQGYTVEAAGDPLHAADLALSSPPSAVLADFWMPGMSGIQLCRLLRTEPATADVPVLLRGDDDDPRHRFWAERAGAFGYVRKGRMGELVRMLARAVVTSKATDDGFFIQLGGGAIDIRERVARYLDAALFESVIAAEVRALFASGSLDRLFDLFCQFLAQVISYRWVALVTHTPPRFALHHHPQNAEQAEREARAALGIAADVPVLCVVDEDPSSDVTGPATLVAPVPFGMTMLGQLALAPSVTCERDTEQLVLLVARELGGPVRIAGLMDEQERLATIDSLTSLRNRRAFFEFARAELARCQRHDLSLSLILLDLDHFKSINDTHGHGAGDQVLAALGGLLARTLRVHDVAARWGGEEFVMALTSTATEGAVIVAERVRNAVMDLRIEYAGVVLAVTASQGVAAYVPGEAIEVLIDRADRAMYRAKIEGRNRVVVAESAAPDEGHNGASTAREAEAASLAAMAQ
jgi:two-component system, cell cycle response regulator